MQYGRVLYHLSLPISTIQSDFANRTNFTVFTQEDLKYVSLPPHKLDGQKYGCNPQGHGRSYMMKVMRNRGRFASSQQHLTHQFITTIDNDVGMLRYPYALTEVGKYDNWSLQKVKVKEESQSLTVTAKVSGGKIDRILI